MSLVPGCSVMIHGLESSTEYNGVFGTLMQFCETDARWEVSVRCNQTKCIRIRERNMRLFMVESVTTYDMFACTEVKATSGKGNGLFATERIPAGTSLVKYQENTDYEPVVAPPFIQFSFNAQPIGDISTAWGLTFKLLQSDATDIPKWFDQLHTNQKLVERVLKDERDHQMMKFAEQKYPTKPVRDIFGKVVTNYTCPSDGSSDCKLDYHESMINHSIQPNAVYMTLNDRPAVIIIDEVNVGEEITVNYDAAGGEKYTRDW